MNSKTVSKLVQDAIRERDQTLTKLSNTTSKKDDLVGGLVRVAAACVGFVSEAAHYRRERKKTVDEVSGHQPDELVDAPAPEQLNEAIWTIDDAGRGPTADETSPPSPKEPETLVEAFLKRHPYEGDVNPQDTLTSPVILVQRRPKTRSRGFVSGYAPLLADVGISQETFLDFIDTFNKALEPNPYLYAINLAGFADLVYPEPIMMLLGFGIGIATDATMEAQSRFRSNKFLDRVNEELFIPRGLVCLVVTWKPDADDGELMTEVGFDGKVAGPHPDLRIVQEMKDVLTQKTSTDEGLRNFREQMQWMMKPSSGTFNWAEPAPLVLPSPDQTVNARHNVRDGKKENAVDRAEKWLDEYMDRRAQAKWIEKNRDLPMANLLPKPGFRSRYADPNHPASSGDVVAFVTGRRWHHGQGKASNSEAGDDRPDLASHGNDEMLKPTEKKDRSRSSGSGNSKSEVGGLTSLLQKDVLYLVVVNLPSQESMDSESNTL